MKKPIFDKYLFIWMQCADFLKSKLPGWEEICSDATKVPEKVRMMIDEIRTPGSTPVSGTPQPSPMVKRNTLVCSSWLGVSSVGVERLQEALLNLSIWDIHSAAQLEYTGLGCGTKIIRLKLWREEHRSKQGSALSWVPMASPAELSLRDTLVPASPYPTFLSVSSSNYILSSSIWT